MKSAYELAMERLEKSAPTTKLTEKQKKLIAEIENLYASKIAERETFLQSQMAKAQDDVQEIEMIQTQLSRDLKNLRAEAEEKKEKIRSEP
jgi:hypothetical protein